MFLTPTAPKYNKSSIVTVAEVFCFAGHFAQGQALSILIMGCCGSSSGERSNANR